MGIYSEAGRKTDDSRIKSSTIEDELRNYSKKLLGKYRRQKYIMSNTRFCVVLYLQIRKINNV